MATQNRVRKEMQIVARWLAGAITAGFIAAGSAGCGDSPTAPKPPGPAPTPSPAPTPLTLTAVSPSTGPAGGGTPVTLTGDGFVSGATVMIGGVRASVTAFTSTSMTASTGMHAVGVVGVVVTNPDGRSASLAEAFTYAPDPDFGPPKITSISPTLGSISGGTWISIRGTGFRSGMAVIVDGVRTQVNVFQEGTSAAVHTVAHPEGRVDVAVMNTDGKSDTVSGGYRFAAPQSFDLDGDWEGLAGSHWEHLFRFTIRNKAIVSASCNGAPVMLSAPVAVEAGRFSATESGVVVLTGDFNTPAYGLGTVNVPLCSGTDWEAFKKVGPSAAR